MKNRKTGSLFSMFIQFEAFSPCMDICLASSLWHCSSSQSIPLSYPVHDLMLLSYGKLILEHDGQLCRVDAKDLGQIALIDLCIGHGFSDPFVLHLNLLLSAVANLYRNNPIFKHKDAEASVLTYDYNTPLPYPLQ